MTCLAPFVPAKAGTQFLQRQDWMPAFAGMSGERYSLANIPADIDR